MRESVKSKYEDIRKEFVSLYGQKHGEKSLPHDVSLFTRVRIASKIKDLRKKYKSCLFGAATEGATAFLLLASSASHL